MVGKNTVLSFLAFLFQKDPRVRFCNVEILNSDIAAGPENSGKLASVAVKDEETLCNKDANGKNEVHRLFLKGEVKSIIQMHMNSGIRAITILEVIDCPRSIINHMELPLGEPWHNMLSHFA
jgi:hypothetical protein